METNNNMQEEKKISIWLVLGSLVALIAVSYLSINSIGDDTLKDISGVDGAAASAGYVIGAVLGSLALLGISILINKAIFFFIKVKKFQLGKLVFALSISSILSILINIILVKVAKLDMESMIITVVSSLSNTAMLTYLIKEEFNDKKQMHLFFIVSLLLTAVPIGISLLLK